MPNRKAVSNAGADALWAEGEHIPTDRIRDIFQVPPGIPPHPSRSALLVGSRGAGKTTFLRHLGTTHKGTALSLSLGADMASISQDLPRGFLAVDADPDEERRISGKAVALAATWMAIRADEAGIHIAPEQLRAALPSGIPKRTPRELSRRTLQNIRVALDRAPLADFGELAVGHPLQQFASELGRTTAAQGSGPLLVLLDRGDNIVPACLATVFQLLDQSDAYTAIAAMRPGPSPPPGLVDTPGRAAPGDHYDVFTLGGRPRSQGWRSFVLSSLRAQAPLASALDTLDDLVVEGVLTLSRDSIRVAIDVLGRVAAEPASSRRDAALDGLDDTAQALQLSARGVLRQFHPDVAALLRGIRADMITEGSAPGTPCLLSVKSGRQSSLLETTTDVDRLIAVGLRCGAFCLPEGARWAPGDRPLEVEVHPLMIWRREDGLPVRTKDPVRLAKSSDDLLGGRRARAKVSIFCAYRMQQPASVTFLAELEHEVRRHPALSAAKVSVSSGKTDPGERWATTIRNRIGKAKAVVADVTQMRPDVIFEAGFAYGRSTPVIPVVEQRQDRRAVPRWLTDLQTAVFTEQAGMSGIINRIVTILNDPRAARRGPPKPAPGKVVWLRTLDWNLAPLEQARAAALHEGLVLEVYPCDDDPPTSSDADDIEDVAVEILIEKAARAHLLAISLDGTSRDDLMHYVAGAVAAKPKTGTDGASRRVLAIYKPGYTPNDLVADSLNRVTEVVRPIEIGQVRDEFKSFAASYKRWATRT